MSSSRFFLFYLAALACTSLAAARPAESLLKTSLKTWLAASPGGVAAAYIDANGVLFVQAGQFSAADPRPVTPDTLFEIGSVTKTFTALLLADAVQAGKVTVDTPVGPPFAPSAVTPLQLATHTSGLPPLPTDFLLGDPENPYASVKLADLVKSFDAVAAGLKPAPSTYSNFGFAVLGHSVAGAWGQPYAELLSSRVLQPLGLRDTQPAWRAADRARLAPPHSPTGPGHNWDLGAFAPAGSITSSTRDLARYVQANLGLVQTPLAAALADTHRPRVPSGSPTGKVGLAWQIEQRGAATVIWHNGATGGYHSFVAFDLAAKTGVVVLSNQARGVEALGNSLLTGKPLPPPRAPVAAAARLQEYIAHYPLAPSFIMAVTAEGEQLFLQATNQPRLKLDPVKADRFKAQGVEAEISFERDPAGKVTALVLHQGGLDQRAPRTAPGEKPRGPREITLPVADLEACVGRFPLGPIDFTVTREEAGLFVQITGQPKAQVFASAKDKFFYKVVNAQLTFVRENDQVVALILHQGARDQRAEKVP